MEISRGFNRILTALPFFVAFGAASAASASVQVSYETIPAADGLQISAIVAQPTSPGPHPLIVMPTSWSLNFIEYSIPAITWAADGFTVVSYTSRGFWESDGDVDVAGAPTVADVSAVIDWAIANTDSDPERVGALGISYGAGISLLAAAWDDRIDSVVALSGWADLEASLYPNETISEASIDLLLTVGDLTGRFGPELLAVQAGLEVGDIGPALELTPSRSASLVVDRINANGTAVMLANGWNDSFFPPNQLVYFFDDIAGEKKLLLAPGDHATAELPGLLGLPTDQWTTALDWMRATVRDGTAPSGPVITLVSNDGDRDVITGADWYTLGTDQTFYLTEPGWWNANTGALSTSSSASWHHEIIGGFDSIATSGTLFITGILQGYLGIPPEILTDFIDRTRAAVWKSNRFYGVDLAGTPRLELTVDSSGGDTSVVAYLYEEPLIGAAKLITHKPLTIRGVAPGQPVGVDFDLESTAWDLEWGSRVVLVIDTVDDRYGTVTEPWTTVGFTSTGGSARLTLPLR